MEYDSEIHLKYTFIVYFRCTTKADLWYLLAAFNADTSTEELPAKGKKRNATAVGAKTLQYPEAKSSTW